MVRMPPRCVFFCETQGVARVELEAGSPQELALLSWLFMGGASGGPTGESTIGPTLARLVHTIILVSQ